VEATNAEDKVKQLENEKLRKEPEEFEVSRAPSSDIVAIKPIEEMTYRLP
jgi:hypothetical protein